MGLLGSSGRQSGILQHGIAFCFLASIAILAPLKACGQDPAVNEFAFEGSVRDSQGHPIAGAFVHLQAKGAKEISTARTDSNGSYRFLSLPEGVYTIRAEMSGFHEATSGPLTLGKGSSKRVDLTIQRSDGAEAKSSSPELLEFFDEPQFTVAGVTEAMNPGGHGNDAILRTTETLAKATVSLKKDSRSLPASPAATSEESLREAVERKPADFDANHRLGKWLADNGRAREALPFLERAAQIEPGDYVNACELAGAYADSGEYERARREVRALLARQEKAELHHLLGDIEEKMGIPLEAVQEYQRAADLDTSESNLFDWGAELLMHRAVEPAIEVFTQGHRLFPRSTRMLVGLGVASYARGSYDQAARRLGEASDLNPDDPNPYMFLGKMLRVGTVQSEGVVERLGRFARLQPENALANYYYALGLWKRRKGPDDIENLARAESLLKKALELDPKLGAAHLQLGILYSDRKDFPEAISAYQRAIEASPRLEEAHYRLAQAYTRTGEKLKAQQELQLHDQISKETAAEVERERREIQQFVYTLRGRTSALPRQ